MQVVIVQRSKISLKHFISNCTLFRSFTYIVTHFSLINVSFFRFCIANFLYYCRFWLYPWRHSHNITFRDVSLTQLTIHFIFAQISMNFTSHKSAIDISIIFIFASKNSAQVFVWKPDRWQKADRINFHC